jgi:hypothetical protein
MSNADTSYTVRLARLRERTQAIFRVRNPDLREFGPAGDATPESIRTSRALGQITQTLESPAGTLTTVPPCCPITCTNPTIANFTVGGYDDGPGSGAYDFRWPVTWTPTPGTTPVFTVTQIPGNTTDISGFIYTIDGDGSADVYADILGCCDDVLITMTLTNDCGSATASGPAGVCFLAGARVAMADGTEKVIEDVVVGDRVIGAFGEVNEVLALHRPLLGANRMCNINGEHHTSNHHPHIGPNRKFYSNDLAWLQSATYGREHDVINADGITEKRMLHGLAAGRVQQLTIGAALKTLEGARPVRTLDVYELPADTQLYNLVIGGSHTFHVDGYAVTGWPREDDFDYDAWTPTRHI